MKKRVKNYLVRKVQQNKKDKKQKTREECRVLVLQLEISRLETFTDKKNKSRNPISKKDISLILKEVY